MEEQPRSSSGGRIPPQDITAEKSLLGAILLSDTTFPEILGILRPQDFYEKRHTLIFQAMISLYDHHKPIDLLTLTAELRSRKNLKAVGGAAYVTELTNFVPTSLHAKAYAELVKKASVRRRLIKAGTTIAEKAYEDDGDPEELIGQAEKELFEVSEKNTENEYSTLEELTVDAFDRIELFRKNKGALRGLKTGFPDLDAKTAGLQKGDLIIVGARPAMGKTTLAHNLAYNVATINKCGVLFFSMEMAKSQIVDRIVSSVSGIDSWKLRTGNVSDEDFPHISDALGEMSDVPLYIDDNSSMTILDIRNKARRAVNDHKKDCPVGMIIVDYLQLIQGTDRYAGQRVQEVTEISRGLKTLARELELPVVALAQLSRSVTGRDDPRPVLSDLRESGSIEQDADIVTFLHRVDYYHQNDDDYEPTNITELIISKHRNGALGKIKLYFHGDIHTFTSVDETRDEE